MNELGCSNSWLGVLWFHIYYELEHQLFIHFFFAYEHFLSPKLISFTLAWDWNTPLQSIVYLFAWPLGNITAQFPLFSKALAFCYLLPSSYKELLQPTH